jgi:large subunit ribosomal protein L1
MARSKSYEAAAKLIDRDRLYTPAEAVRLAKQTSTTKRFDATVEVAMRLGVDPRKADQMVRGTVSLPHGTGKTARVAVFATGEKAEEARAAGADIVGGDELIAQVEGGMLDFDAAVSTPDLMGKVGRLGRVLGPRGLMPNPKTGTVTMDVGKAVEDIKGGKIEFRVDRQANLHFVIGKTSFSEDQLLDNYIAAFDEVSRAKPSTAKGRYIKKVAISTTMGPGILVDSTKGRSDEASEAPAAAAPVPAATEEAPAAEEAALEAVAEVGAPEVEAAEAEATEPEATEPEATEPEATEPEATEPEVTESE